MKRRLQAFWEPIYDSKATEISHQQSLGEENDIVTYYSVITLLSESSNVWTNETISLNHKEFYGCDITEFFDDRYITFKNCTFRYCDFAASHWKSAKFTRCHFISSSISLTTFEDCEFRNCTWESIGISGNETVLKDTIITAPNILLDNVYVQTDAILLANHGSNLKEQLDRNISSKSELARSIMLSHRNVGKEDDYYLSVKAFAKLNALSKAKTFSWKSAHSWAYWQIEYMVHAIIGSINGWGNNTLRPFAVGIGIVVIMALINANIFETTYPLSLKQTVDIFLIAGYGKYDSSGILQEVVKISNLVLGIVWYSTVIATFVNRISRVR